jgi:hypothetical protein
MTLTAYLVQTIRRLLLLAIAAAGFGTLYFASPFFAGDYGVAGLSDDFVRDVAHVVVYGTLAATLGWALSWRTLAWLLSVLCASAEEVHQLFIPWRFGCLGDWCLNVAGITLFLLATHVIATRRYLPSQIGAGLPAQGRVSESV